MGKARWNETPWRHPTPECWPRSSGRQSHPTVISPSNNACLTLNEPARRQVQQAWQAETYPYREELARLERDV
jgi:hypothetical protein